MLKYPISVIEYNWSKKVGIDNPFPVLGSFEIEKITKLLPYNYISEIKSIAGKDQETQDLFRYISELPEMTEEEKETQIIEFDKSMIENGNGFIEWEAMELKLIEKYTPKDKKKVLDRIVILKKWAIENNMMQPKIERFVPGIGVGPK